MDLSVLATIDLEAIAEPGARQAIRSLLALLEEVVAEHHAVRAENQRLKDEHARLKGEQGQPRIRPQSQPAGATDYSSEGERHTPTPWRKGAKRDALTITRTERLTVDRATLPADAQFKGIETVVVQDLRLVRDTICFEKEVWYSPSQQRSYQAALPAGYEGQFGPGLKGLALALHFVANVTEAKVLELFRESGVVVSKGWLGSLLSGERGDVAGFGAEAREVARAGLASSPWQHVDDTATRVNGQNEHCQVLGNELFTAYHTTPKKDRLTVLDVLRGSPAGGDRTYLLNAEAEAYLDWSGLSARAWQHLAHLPRAQALDAAAFAAWEQGHGTGLGPQQRTRIREALAIAAYHAQTAWPIVECVVCDDAPQFRELTAERALCWVHEGRHYTKLTAYLPQYRVALDAFRTQFWEYYRDLLRYREEPTAAISCGTARNRRPRSGRG